MFVFDAVFWFFCAFLATARLEGDAEGNDGRRCVCVPQNLCNDNEVVNGQGLLDIRFPVHPCKNYFEVCCESPINQPGEPGEEEPEAPPATLLCGESVAMAPRITTDSQDTQFAELPWTVVVLQRIHEGSEKVLYKCGGSLIHPQAVLTAVHCVQGLMAPQLVVRAGEWNTRSQQEPLPHQDRGVKEILPHPHHHPRSLKNDVALVFLGEPFVLVDNVNVICLPPPGLTMDDSRCVAAGWGKNTFKRGSHSSTLRKVELPIVPRDRCLASLRKTRLGPFYSLHRSFVCAGGEPNRDTCKGDGGGPLVCQVPGQDGRYLQIGIVAWGIGCGESDTPGVYVNVALYRNWIDKQLAARDLDTSVYKYD